MSRERLATKAGVSARTIYAVESGDVRPQRATRHVLAEALAMAEAELFLDDEAVGRAVDRGRDQ